MTRPDYWTKPIRTSRDGSIYGHHRLTPEYRAQLKTDRWLVPLVAGLGIAVTLAVVAMGV